MSSFSFTMGMDPNSLDISRDGRFIGFLQKHPEREPRIILREAGEHLTRRELELCHDKFKEFTGKQGRPNGC